MDNALEFVSNTTLSEYLCKLGIIHEKSAPYEHHQNGTVERMNRTLSEMSRALIHLRALPPTMWSFAFKHAAYIFNQVLHHGKDITPLEAVLGRKPSLAMLRVFGFSAYAYDPTHTKQVVPYARKLRHVGISPDSRAWLLWCEETGKISTAALVQFDEAPVIHAAYSMEVLEC